MHVDVESRRLLAALDVSVSLIAKGGAGGEVVDPTDPAVAAVAAAGGKVKGRKKKTKAVQRIPSF